MGKDKKKKKKVVKARQWDTLCGIAVKNGFRDCADLRKEPDNAYLQKQDWELRAGDKITIPDKQEKDEDAETEKLTKFIKPGEPVASIRFVHGSEKLPYADDKALTVLDVSNFKTDMAGKNRQYPWVDDTVHEFEGRADADPDAFKVEVHDAHTKNNELKVTLEALRPVYKTGTQPTKTGNPTGWQPYDDTYKAAGRQLVDLVAERMPKGATAPTDEERKKRKAKTRFRTCYLRLVVDENDWNARKKQTLRIEPIVDTDENRKLEIIDHHVRAIYEIDSCTSDPKCRVVAEVPVGEDKHRVRMAVHVVESAPGTGELAIPTLHDRLLLHVRQFYAQLNLSFQCVETTRLVPPPANLIVIADRMARLAFGGKEIKVQVKIDTVSKDVAIKTVKNKKPMHTAEALATAIRKAFAPTKVDVEATENPKLSGKAYGSADVRVGRPLTQKIELTLLSAAGADPYHDVQIGQVIAGQAFKDFEGDESHVGTPPERALLKNYNTGSDRIDIFIVHGLAGAHGEGFIQGRRYKGRPRARDEVVNSVIITAGCADGTSGVGHIGFGHEMGHVLMDNFHALDTTELMHKGFGDPVKYNHELDAMKRFADPAYSKTQDCYVPWDDGQALNPTHEMREAMSKLQQDWTK